MALPAKRSLSAIKDASPNPKCRELIHTTTSNPMTFHLRIAITATIAIATYPTINSMNLVFELLGIVMRWSTAP